MDETYKTKSGDTWDIIAYQQLGSCEYVNLLIDSNRQYIDTVIFSAGIELKLPEIATSIAKNLPPWRR